MTLLSLRVARRISFTTCSAVAFVATGFAGAVLRFFIIFNSNWGKDEPQILRYAIMPNCSMGADGGHPLDKVNRQFRVPAPNMLRVSDFTYVATWKGFAHAASSSKPIPRRGPWRSFEAVDYATLEWVDRFNNRRLLEPVRTVPPAEAEANYHAALETEAMAA